jgi:hypothetical protein
MEGVATRHVRGAVKRRDGPRGWALSCPDVWGAHAINRTTRARTKKPRNRLGPMIVVLLLDGCGVAGVQRGWWMVAFT